MIFEEFVEPHRKFRFAREAIWPNCVDQHIFYDLAVYAETITQPRWAQR